MSWTYENVESRENRDAYGVVKDANGKILFDSLNSDVAEIHEEWDEGSVHRWDETARVNLTLAASAPDLLAACEEAGRFLAAFNPDGHEDGVYLLRVGIRAAIAKAKGNQ